MLIAINILIVFMKSRVSNIYLVFICSCCSKAVTQKDQESFSSSNFSVLRVTNNKVLKKGMRKIHCYYGKAFVFENSYIGYGKTRNISEHQCSTMILSKTNWRI